MSITAEQAKALAIDYAGFVGAKTDLDNVVWGRALLEMQKETGVEIMTTATIEACVKEANRALKDSGFYERALEKRLATFEKDLTIPPLR